MRLPAKHFPLKAFLFCLILMTGWHLPESFLHPRPARANPFPAGSGQHAPSGVRASVDNGQNKNIKDFFLLGDFIHKNNIRTVLFHKKGFELAPPIIRLHSGERLELRFDDLDADYKNYAFTVVHCNADWTPSDLNPFDYLDGFFEDQVREYSQSVNTRIPYSHYRLEFPNENLRPRLSGNYLLKVYTYGAPDEVVLTRRLMIHEPLVGIDAQVQMANLIRFRDQWQQLSFTLQTGGYPIRNPHRDLQVVIIQNGRWDNAMTDLVPRTVMGDRLVYDQEDRILFEGGNEFRRFDTRSLRFLTERVADIQSGPRHWDVFLLPDQRRGFRQYASDDDLNGRFAIDVRDGRDPMVEADYAWVHFSLPMATPLASGGIYVMGALTGWHFPEEGKLGYNYGDSKYELSLLLKQGYYNYLYAFVDEGETRADLGVLEGNHSQAENDYTILVYHREPGTRYDRLVGLTHLNTAVGR
jgi:hypothetical protein